MTIMNVARLTSVVVKVKLNSTWTDISADVLTSSMNFQWGMLDNNPITSLIAPAGTVTMQLNNKSGKYTPSGPNTLSGWRKGIEASIDMTYDSFTYRRFFGTVGDIEFDAKRKGSIIPITLVDWLDYAARHPMANLPIAFNKRANEVFTDILNLVSRQPIATDISTGLTTFPLVYSTITRKTRAYTELSKLAASEYGRIYLRREVGTGETLVLENIKSRHGWREPDQIPGPPDYILKAGSATDYLLQAGTNSRFILQQTSATIPITLSNIFLEGQLNITQGSDVLNIVEFSAYPSKTDTVAQKLFTLQEPIKIGSGQTVIIRGNYHNATVGVDCNGQNMINPVANTDYKAWTQSNGSGTDFTASLVITPSYFASSFEHSVFNNSGNGGYITQFDCRGYGVYIENTISARIEDQDSVDELGEYSATLDQKYQRTLDTGTIIAKSIIEQHKFAELNLKSVSFNANSSPLAMRIAMLVDIGDLAIIESDLGNVSSRYFIVRIQMTLVNGVLTVTYWLDEHLSIASGSLSEIAVEFAAGTKQAVNFGPLPYLMDLPTRTFTAWVKNTSTTGTIQLVAGMFSDNSACALATGSVGHRAIFYQKYAPNGFVGYYTDLETLPLNTWCLMSVVFTLKDELHKIYVNGVPLTVFVSGGPINLNKTAFTDAGVPFIIGNTKTATRDYDYAFDGIIQDVRVYNRELTEAELVTMYNGGDPKPDIGVNDNMLFQFGAVRTTTLDEYVDQVLTDKIVFDNYLLMVGTVNANPIGRAPL